MRGPESTEKESEAGVFLKPWGHVDSGLWALQWEETAEISAARRRFYYQGTRALLRKCSSFPLKRS